MTTSDLLTIVAKKREQPDAHAGAPTMNVNVQAGTPQLLRAYTDKRGLKQGWLMGRLVSWFVRVPAPLRRIVEMEPESAEERRMYADLLEAEARRLREGASTFEGLPVEPFGSLGHVSGAGGRQSSEAPPAPSPTRQRA